MGDTLNCGSDGQCNFNSMIKCADRKYKQVEDVLWVMFSLSKSRGNPIQMIRKAFFSIICSAHSFCTDQRNGNLFLHSRAVLNVNGNRLYSIRDDKKKKNKCMGKHEIICNKCFRRERKFQRSNYLFKGIFFYFKGITSSQTDDTLTRHRRILMLSLTKEWRT